MSGDARSAASAAAIAVAHTPNSSAAGMDSVGRRSTPEVSATLPPPLGRHQLRGPLARARHVWSVEAMRATPSTAPTAHWSNV
eukprot:2108975-Pleurochrysis_carterae.AAC.1